MLSIGARGGMLDHIDRCISVSDRNISLHIWAVLIVSDSVEDLPNGALSEVNERGGETQC